jgi:hypothetical protein
MRIVKCNAPEIHVYNFTSGLFCSIKVSIYNAVFLLIQQVSINSYLLE